MCCLLGFSLKLTFCYWVEEADQMKNQLVAISYSSAAVRSAYHEHRCRLFIYLY